MQLFRPLPPDPVRLRTGTHRFLLVLLQKHLLELRLRHFSALLLKYCTENNIPLLPHLLHCLGLVDRLVRQYGTLVIDHLIDDQLQYALQGLTIQLVVRAVGHLPQDWLSLLGLLRVCFILLFDV